MFSWAYRFHSPYNQIQKPDMRKQNPRHRSVIYLHSESNLALITTAERQPNWLTRIVIQAVHQSKAQKVSAINVRLKISNNQQIKILPLYILTPKICSFSSITFNKPLCIISSSCYLVYSVRNVGPWKGRKRAGQGRSKTTP